MTDKTSVTRLADALSRTLLSITVGPYIDFARVLAGISGSDKELDKQISEVVAALQKSNELIANLEATVTERADKLTKLKGDIERYSELATISEQDASALLLQVESSLGKRQVRERVIAALISLGVGLFIFLVGVFAADWVKMLPELLSTFFQKN